MFCENCQRNFSQPAASTTPPSSISSTDLQQLLRSPYPPSATQILEIPSIVTNINAEIRHHESRILRLQSEMKLLENKQQQLKIRRQRYNSLLAPVRRLHTEVLDHVFVMYANIVGCNMNSIGPSLIFLPGQTLMSVCVRWREIANSCKPLWTNIALELGSTENVDIITETMQWCLDRAGPTAPLNIILDTAVEDTDIEEAEFCKLLTAQASRWRELSLYTQGDLGAMLPSVFEVENPSFPSLEALHLVTPRELGPFSNAPKLHELSFSGVADMEGNKPVFPWSQIKTLKLQLYNQHRIPITPSLFPELESLSYTLSPFLSVMPVIPYHTLNTLQALSVSLAKAGPHTGPPKALRKVLESACYPALKRLVVDLNIYATYNAYAVVGRDAEELGWPQREVTSFILRSGCSLTFLQLRDTFISTRDLLTLLLHTPALSHLELYQPHRCKPTEEQLRNMVPDQMGLEPLTMAWIKRLHAHGTEDSYDFGNPLVPKLTHLSLTVLSDWFNDDQLFVNVILSRWVPDLILASEIGVACLKSVELKVWGRLLDDKVYQPLLQLGNLVGMKVELLGEIPPIPITT